MDNFVNVLLIAIGLSMDAFSLAVLYGTLNFDKRKTLTLASMVGVFHFFMPLFGNLVGVVVLRLLPIMPDTLIGFIFLMISIEMFLSVFKKEEIVDLKSLLAIIIFAFTVSIDSFSVGIGLSAIYNNVLWTVSTFAITSFTFTYIGLRIGARLNKYFEKLSVIIGSVILFVLSIVYLF